MVALILYVILAPQIAVTPQPTAAEVMRSGINRLPNAHSVSYVVKRVYPASSFFMFIPVSSLGRLRRT
jgi:hypothetical protein